MNYGYKVSSILTITMAVFLGGCSAPFFSESAPEETKEELFYHADYAQKVINAGTQIHNQRYQKAWTKGPSELVIKYHQLNGTNPYDNWEPDVKEPVYESDTLIKYEDALAISEHFKGTGVDVKFNDDLIVVTMPNSWAWYPNSSKRLKTESKRYLSTLPDVMKSEEIRLFVKTSTEDLDFGISALAIATDRSEFVSELLSQSFQIPSSQIVALGINASPNSRLHLDKRGVTQIYIRHNLATNAQRVLADAEQQQP